MTTTNKNQCEPVIPDNNNQIITPVWTNEKLKDKLKERVHKKEGPTVS
jgi:hypothetical protein